MISHMIAHCIKKGHYFFLCDLFTSIDHQDLVVLMLLLISLGPSQGMLEVLS